MQLYLGEHDQELHVLHPNSVVAMNIRATSAFKSARTSKGCSPGREIEISHEWTCMEGKVWLSIPMEWKPDSR